MAELRKDIKRPEGSRQPAQRFVAPSMGGGDPDSAIDAAEDALKVAQRQGDRKMAQIAALLMEILKEQRRMTRDQEFIRNRLDSIEKRLPTKSRQGY